MAGNPVLDNVLVSGALPARIADGNTTGNAVRGGSYGEVDVNVALAARQRFVQEGSYYVLTNPTPGTGVQSGLVTARSATANGMFTILNNDAATNGRSVYLDYLALMMSGTAPAGTTVMNWEFHVDSGSRTPTAGNTAVTPVNVNPLYSNVGVTINAFTGAASMTIPAAVNDRLVGRAQIPTSLGITGDVYVVQFGAQDQAGGAVLTAVRATAPARLVVQTVPLVIPPGYTAVLDMWWVTQATTAPTWEYELGYIQR